MSTSAGAADSAGISAMTVSPNRRLLALAERGERPSVTVFDLTSMKKRKVLTHTEAGTKVHCAPTSASLLGTMTSQCVFGSKLPVRISSRTNI